MDPTSKYFTANYPYPNLKCIVNFICYADGEISSNIVASSNHFWNTFS